MASKPVIVGLSSDTVHESGRSLLLCGAREQPSQLMKQAEFERHVGAENICPSISEALARAADVYGKQHPQWSTPGVEVLSEK